jgi:outer membrane receptor for ferrienterochelin and colicins
VKIITTLLGLFLTLALQAQNTDTLSAKELEAVIITGQYEPQSVKKSVYQARIISMEKILSKGAVRMQDVLNTELNIRFTQDLALGGSNLSLQGLAGQNVKVLIDGAPMVGRQGTSNEININQLNIHSIERIEIIEGPMSVVYGADALAGVINIITKKDVDGKVSLTATIHEESIGNEYGLKKGIHNQSLSAGYSKNKFILRTDLSRNYFGGWQGNAQGRDKQWHPKDQYLASMLTGFNGTKTNLTYRADYLFENINNPGEYQGGEAIDQNYYTNRLMQQVQGSHTFSNKLQTNGVLSYTLFERETQTTTVNEATGDRRLALGEGLQDVTQFNGLTYRQTFQYKWSDKLSIQPGVDVNLESGSGGRIKEGTQRIGDLAFFLSAEWQLNARIQIRPGVRMMHNTVYQAPPIVPSLNAKVKLNATQDLRLAYGRGFRAPSLRELYFDFFDASHAIEGNTNLEAEYSNSFNASWNWRIRETEKNTLTTVLGGFYNSLQNMIGYGQKPGNTLVTTYLNIDRYKTTGVTWNNTLKRKQWDVNLGFAYTGRYNQLNESYEETEPFNWSAEVTSSFNYRIPSKGLNFSLYYKLTGRTPFYEIVTADGNTIARLAETSAFHWSDLTIQKSLGKSLWLTVGSHNLFNVKNINTTSMASGVHTGGASRPIGSGRSYFISLSYTLNK